MVKEDVASFYLLSSTRCPAKDSIPSVHHRETHSKKEVSFTSEAVNHLNQKKASCRSHSRLD